MMSGKFQIQIDYGNTIWCDNEEKIYEELKKLSNWSLERITIYEDITDKIKNDKNYELLRKYDSEKFKELNSFVGDLYDLHNLLDITKRLTNSKIDIDQVTNLLKLEFNNKFNKFLELKKDFPDIVLDYDYTKWKTFEITQVP